MREVRRVEGGQGCHLRLLGEALAHAQLEQERRQIVRGGARGLLAEGTEGFDGAKVHAVAAARAHGVALARLLGERTLDGCSRSTEEVLFLLDQRALLGRQNRERRGPCVALQVVGTRAGTRAFAEHERSGAQGQPVEITKFPASIEGVERGAGPTHSRGLKMSGKYTVTTPPFGFGK